MGHKLLLTLSFFLLTACGTSTPKPVPATISKLPELDATTIAWRTCYFKTTWPEEQEPRWEVDVMLAHHYLGPVLKEFEPTLQAWRFHRRAARDEAGHLFRFHFFTDSVHAAQVINRIQQDPLREKLIASGVMQSIDCMSATDMTNTNLGDTSDPSWPETLRDNWPPYIMGISWMWLGLIDDAMRNIGPPSEDIDRLLDQYKRANDAVTTLWHVQGEHALLHHLNAIFGYQPIHITF